MKFEDDFPSLKDKIFNESNHKINEFVLVTDITKYCLDKQRVINILNYLDEECANVVGIPTAVAILREKLNLEDDKNGTR